MAPVISLEDNCIAAEDVITELISAVLNLVFFKAGVGGRYQHS